LNCLDTGCKEHQGRFDFQVRSHRRLDAAMLSCKLRCNVSIRLLICKDGSSSSSKFNISAYNGI
jgi:hypothetical protein